jgi:hypothetical protein
MITNHSTTINSIYYYMMQMYMTMYRIFIFYYTGMHGGPSRPLSDSSYEMDFSFIGGDEVSWV